MQKCHVTGIVSDAAGNALSGATIGFTLTKREKDGTIVIMPSPVSVKLGQDGALAVDLWPNSRGNAGTIYVVTVDAPNEKGGYTTYPSWKALVPDQETAVLNDISELAPPDSTDDVLAAVLQAREARDAAEGYRDETKDLRDEVMPLAPAVTVVSANITAVNTVAGRDADIATVAARDADIHVVAGRDADIGKVAGIDAEVGIVAGKAAQVEAVAAVADDVEALAPVAGDVTAVAGIKVDVEAVAAIDADVSAVAAKAADVSTVAGVAADVTTVAGIAADVTAVAGIDDDVSALSPIAADITTAAANIADIQAAPGAAVAASDSADLSAAWAEGHEPGGAGTKSAKEWAQTVEDLAPVAVSQSDTPPTPAIGRFGVLLPRTPIFADGSIWRLISDGSPVDFTPSLFSNGEQGALYDISDLSTLFQDTAGTVRVTAVGQTVKRINDKSGNGVHLTNATGWILGQDALGGYYLATDGATAFSGNAPGLSGTALSLAVAFNNLSTPASNQFMIGLGNTGNASDWGGLRIINTTGLVDFPSAGALGNTSVASTSPGVPSDPHVYISRTAGPTVYRNLIANIGTGSIANLGAVNLFSLGAIVRMGSSAFFGNGRIYGALIIARSLTDAEVVALNGYMRSKFGATGFLIAIGDSHTLNSDYGVTEAQFYPRRLDAALGDKKIPLNFGISGNTTANMVSRLPTITQPGKPDLAVIYGGTNDNGGLTTVQASPAPTTTAFTVASTIGARYGAGGLITVNGVNAEVASVTGDRITLTAPLGFTPSAGQAVAIRTTDNLIKIGQAIQALGCQRILIPGLHYYNFASGLGDTIAVPNVNAVPIRAAEQAAASTLGAIYVDLYAYMRDLIVAGTYTQGDDLAWHVAVNNAHLNATGEQILADAMYVAMQAQGWA